MISPTTENRAEKRPSARSGQRICLPQAGASPRGVAPSSPTQLLRTLLFQEQVMGLTLSDPWGSLIALGCKRNETRTWGTTYRGPLAIHVATSFSRVDAFLTSRPAWHQASEQMESLPAFSRKSDCHSGIQGMVIAVAWLEEIWQISEETVDKLPDRRHPEYAFGDYRPGHYVWSFSSIYRLSRPLLAHGKPGLWRWTPPEAFWEEIGRQIARGESSHVR